MWASTLDWAFQLNVWYHTLHIFQLKTPRRPKNTVKQPTSRGRSPWSLVPHQCWTLEDPRTTVFFSCCWSFPFFHFLTWPLLTITYRKPLVHYQISNKVCITLNLTSPLETPNHASPSWLRHILKTLNSFGLRMYSHTLTGSKVGLAGISPQLLLNLSLSKLRVAN